MTSTRLALNDFFVAVQARALKQAELAVGNRDEALDILQDAMIKLAQNYAEQAEDWPRLFQRILQNAIRDWYRRKKVRSILLWWNQSADQANSVEEALAQSGEQSCAVTGAALEPEATHQRQQIGERVRAAVATLPLRQQQAFTLRAWWGHDIEETAYAMGCSTGSVKTHYSRAIAKLQQTLGELEL